MHKITQNNCIAPLPLAFGAVLLLMISSGVIFVWHFPKLTTSVYPFATLMAYNTALSFLLCGIALLAIIKQYHNLSVTAAASILILGGVRIAEMLFGSSIGTEYWYNLLLPAPITAAIPTSSITSVTFVFTATSLLILSQPTLTPRKILLTAFISLIVMTIACAILIGHGLQLFPGTVWAGRKMSPHTALCFVVCALVIIMGIYPKILDAFNRLNFFNRMTMGFLFMSLLFIGIGSIGILQINSVADISQKLYKGPFQTNNAALRIKNHIALLNRTIKNIAINPNLANHNEYRSLLKNTIINIEQEFNQISSEPEYTQDLQRLRNQLSAWEEVVSSLFEQFERGNTVQYQNKALNKNQEHIVALENSCDLIIQQAQQEMQKLNWETIQTKQHAGNLMLIVIIGFLIVGVCVSALITRSLNQQIRCIRHAMLRIAEGHSETKIPFLDYPYEIGDMATTLQTFALNVIELQSNTELLQQQQQQLEKTNQQLALTNNELETFAYVASHDLKSPLRGIAQLSTWIDEDLESNQPTEVNKHTNMLRKRILRMEKLLDDMLIFYRAGKTDGSITSVDVRLLATELFEIQNTSTGLYLTTAADLPVLDTYSTPFEQVLRNLFSNAIKHHDTGEGFIHIHSQKINAMYYKFSVCDDGPGIPEKYKERVFGMFQTLKPRDDVEGSGMGLALIKKIVTSYGGTVSLDSADRGCCFHFTWPINIKGHDHG